MCTNGVWSYPSSIKLTSDVYLGFDTLNIGNAPWSSDTNVPDNFLFIALDPANRNYGSIVAPSTVSGSTPSAPTQLNIRLVAYSPLGAGNSWTFPLVNATSGVTTNLITGLVVDIVTGYSSTLICESLTAKLGPDGYVTINSTAIPCIAPASVVENLRYTIYDSTGAGIVYTSTRSFMATQSSTIEATAIRSCGVLARPIARWNRNVIRSLCTVLALQKSSCDSIMSSWSSAVARPFQLFYLYFGLPGSKVPPDTAAVLKDACTNVPGTSTTFYPNLGL